MSKRILVVEDNEINRKIMRDLLTYDGYTVEEAVDGNEALVMARSNPPDLIFMDIQLPGADGYAVTRSLRADTVTESIPIVAITSFALSNEEEKALAAGCDSFMTKPIDIQAVLQEVANRLGSKHE